MRKMLRLGLCVGVLAAALTCSALAAEGVATDGWTTANENCTVTYNAASKNYTASYTGAKAGNQYALLVVKGTVSESGELPPINDNTIMYIDQMPATADGVSFTFIPKSTPDCVVLLGGVFEDKDGEAVTSPVTLGTLKGQGTTVSGSVSVSNAAKAMTIELYQQGTTTNPVYTVTIPAASSGGSAKREFSLDGVAEGTYDLKVTQEGNTDYWITGVPVGSDPLTLPETITPPCGDINGDNTVNLDDLGVLISSGNYNKKSTDAQNSEADLNGDGGINIDDLGIILSSKNYNKGEIKVDYGA